MFGRHLSRSADLARARLHGLGGGWVPAQRDVDRAFNSQAPTPHTGQPPPVEASSWPAAPDEPRSPRLRLGPEAARGLVLLAVVAVVAAAVVALLAWPRGQVAPSTVNPPVVAGASTMAIVGVAPAASASSNVVVVDVAGEVRRPGVRELPTGSRVVDAIDAAGGLTTRAVTTSLNLARVLTDGEQVLVAGRVPSAGVSLAPSVGGTDGSTPVSVNSATLDQLDALPGIGPVLAQAIIDYRTQNGPFATLDQLLEVSGIGDATFADLQGLVTL